ncbi:MAG: NAD-dependent epimerase/dehydratase family protein [Ruminococcus sp.]|nr:NAD-dependent epimerase/dehydratase family protein [Ruminococcus sp.]
MKILVTGAGGFVGKNLVAELMNISEGKCAFAGIDKGCEVFTTDIDTPAETLKSYCKDCDFVFHLAGINRPKDEKEFTEGNLDSLTQLLNFLIEQGNTCPVALSSSTQAALSNPYGISKRCAEDTLRQYAEDTGEKVYIFRFPGLFGKWCRPNYNSVVATFCHNTANGLELRIDAPQKEITLAYIDDVVRALLLCVGDVAVKDADGFCVVNPTYTVSLQRLADLLASFKLGREKLEVPYLADSFERALYATYLSYLPKDKFSYPLNTHSDYRGSFTEIIRTPDRGQFSVNISKPHITKGNHWHHTKNEKFCVVSGSGVIRFRKPLSDEVIEYFVSGEKIEVVDIPTGYTHNIENLGDTDMVTFMWASEAFDPERPDTYFLEV